MKKKHVSPTHSASRRVSASGLPRLTVLLILTIASTLALGLSPIQDDEYDTNTVQDNVQFTKVDIIIDAHDNPLAAWQIELDAPQNVMIVGIQNGDFSTEAPHYDPAALQSNRVILAQYSLEDASSLLSGEIRAATLHLLVEGELDLNELEIELTAAGDERGERIVNATVRLEKSNE